MGEGIIKICSGAVLTSKSDIKLCANNFKIENIDFNVRSNITAVQTASSTYSSVCSSITKAREILLTDAERIGQIDNGFAAADWKLTHLLSE